MVGAVLLCGLLVSAGCTNTTSRLNSPPQGASDKPNQMQEQYTFMNDNALLAEMSISPAHFLPNRADLNGSGLRRLNRYVELLQQYGGTLHYDGVNDPEPLAKERMERVRGYLAQAGVDAKSCPVELGLAGGTGMRGQEAGEVRKASNFSPEQAKNEGKGGDWGGAK
jgi:hypothetical protein